MNRRRPSTDRRDAGPIRTSRPNPRRDEPAEVTVPKQARLYGVAPVLEAIQQRAVAFDHIVIAEGAAHYRLRELSAAARDAGIPVRRVPRQALDREAGPGANHQGVVATVAAARYADPDELLESWARRVDTIEPPLGLVLDGVEDPHNLGALMRTVECAGGHGIFIPERRAVGLTETVAKAAAGAMEYVPVARAPNLVRLLEHLKKANIWTVGTAADAPMDYTEWDWTRPSAIVLGGEGSGLHRLVRENCDALVRIPLHGKIESLNVSVSGGILLYEALRQRTKRG
jgi:23S rRNA (guanosine2251-2'-O)-methyltransferase